MEDGLNPPPAQYKHRIRARTEPFWCLLLSVKPFMEQKHCKYSLMLAISGRGKKKNQGVKATQKKSWTCFLDSFWVRSHGDKWNRLGELKTELAVKPD